MSYSQEYGQKSFLATMKLRAATLGHVHLPPPQNQNTGFPTPTLCLVMTFSPIILEMRISKLKIDNSTHLSSGQENDRRLGKTFLTLGLEIRKCFEI